jgi:hypothetical protein
MVCERQAPCHALARLQYHVFARMPNQIPRIRSWRIPLVLCKCQCFQRCTLYFAETAAIDRQYKLLVRPNYQICHESRRSFGSSTTHSASLLLILLWSSMNDEPNAPPRNNMVTNKMFGVVPSTFRIPSAPIGFAIMNWDDKSKDARALQDLSAPQLLINPVSWLFVAVLVGILI